VRVFVRPFNDSTVVGATLSKELAKKTVLETIANANSRIMTYQLQWLRHTDWTSVSFLCVRYGLIGIAAPDVGCRFEHWG
jgi:hypothetical protein